jgi:hypothetical protein
LIGNVGGVLLLLLLPLLLFCSFSLGYSAVDNCTAGHHGCFCCCHCQVCHPQRVALCHATTIALEAGGGVQLFESSLLQDNEKYFVRFFLQSASTINLAMLQYVRDKVFAVIDQHINH